MSIIKQIKKWILDFFDTILDIFFLVVISLILYPLLAFVKIVDFVMTILCRHQYGIYDPNYCYKCGKVKKSNEHSNAQAPKTETPH